MNRAVRPAVLHHPSFPLCLHFATNKTTQLGPSVSDLLGMWKLILHVPLTGVTGQKTRGSQKQGNVIAIMIAVICFHDFGFFYKSLSGTSPERTLKQNIVAPKLRKKKKQSIDNIYRN